LTLTHSLANQHQHHQQQQQQQQQDRRRRGRDRNSAASAPLIDVITDNFTTDRIYSSPSSAAAAYAMQVSRLSATATCLSTVASSLLSLPVASPGSAARRTQSYMKVIRGKKCTE